MQSEHLAARPEGTKAATFASQSMPGAGHPAWGIGFRPRYSIPGLESGSDTEAVVVMVGVAPAPAAASVLFMPVRSSQPALLSDITYQLHTLSVAS